MAFLVSMVIYIDEDVEKQNTGGLLLAAPLVDLYLKEIGTAILTKLQRPRLTGLLVSKPILIPWSVMTCIVKLIISYGRPKELGEDKGSKCLTTLKKNGHKIMEIVVCKESCSKKVWHPLRFGKTLTSRRRYSKVPVPEENRQKSVFAGSSRLVVNM